MVIWITGLAGSGKTTIGSRVFENIKKVNENTVFFDGDIIREIFGHHGYEREQRLELAKKISNLCSLMEKQNINVVCSTISLFKEIHELNRSKIKDYYEIFLDVDFNELLKRDQKGLYTGALNGKVKNVIGIDIKYDIPANPHLVLDNNNLSSLDDNIQKIMDTINI